MDIEASTVASDIHREQHKIFSRFSAILGFLKNADTLDGQRLVPCYRWSLKAGDMWQKNITEWGFVTGDC